jgi:hypothetical protein
MQWKVNRRNGLVETIEFTINSGKSTRNFTYTLLSLHQECPNRLLVQVRECESPMLRFDLDILYMYVCMHLCMYVCM